MEKLEVLPYHALGKVKYDNLGMDYVLKDTPQLTKEEAKKSSAVGFDYVDYVDTVKIEWEE